MQEIETLRLRMHLVWWFDSMHAVLQWTPETRYINHHGNLILTPMGRLLSTNHQALIHQLYVFFSATVFYCLSRKAISWQRNVPFCTHLGVRQHSHTMLHFCSLFGYFSFKFCNGTTKLRLIYWQIGSYYNVIFHLFRNIVVLINI